MIFVLYVHLYNMYYSKISVACSNSDWKLLKTEEEEKKKKIIE